MKWRIIMSENIIRKLDTSKMDAAILAFGEGIKEYNNIRSTVKQATSELLLHWSGKGRQAFEKEYDEIFLQLTDIEDILNELYHALVDGLNAYRTTDQELSKNLIN
jgi:WXG100 family type VII secretion target